MASTHAIKNGNLTVEIDSITLIVTVTDRTMGHRWVFGENADADLRV